MRFLRTTCLAVAVGAMAAAWAAGGLAAAGEADLAVKGGACQDCMVDQLACTGTSCLPAGGGTWSYKNGTLLSVLKCFNVGAGAPGLEECKSDTPKPCYELATCTDVDCTNCTDDAADQRNSNCGLTGYHCRG